MWDNPDFSVGGSHNCHFATERIHSHALLETQNSNPSGFFLDIICPLLQGEAAQGIEGLERLSKVGLRYPIPNYGIQMDPSEGLAVSYMDVGKK
jgi:hypothetical protein